MDINEQLLEALEGIRQEIGQLNKTVAALAAKQPARSFSPTTADKPESPERRGGYSRPTGARGRIAGGYKRSTGDGESKGAGFDSDKPTRFTGTRRPSAGGGFKGKGAPKKSGGYPKKPR